MLLDTENRGSEGGTIGFCDGCTADESLKCFCVDNLVKATIILLKWN